MKVDLSKLFLQCVISSLVLVILPHFNGHSAKRVFGFKRIGAQIAQTRM